MLKVYHNTSKVSNLCWKILKSLIAQPNSICLTFFNHILLLLHRIHDFRTIHILHQQKDWMGGFRKTSGFADLQYCIYVDLGPFNMWLISSWEKNNCCYLMAHQLTEPSFLPKENSFQLRPASWTNIPSHKKQSSIENISNFEMKYLTNKLIVDCHTWDCMRLLDSTISHPTVL